MWRSESGTEVKVKKIIVHLSFVSVIHFKETTPLTRVDSILWGASVTET